MGPKLFIDELLDQLYQDEENPDWNEHFNAPSQT
jgi:hypothetical protein